MNDSPIIEFPKSAIRQVAPSITVDFDIGYRHSLRDRAHKLAPILWELTERPNSITWSAAIQEPKLAEAMAKCLATAEMVIRLVDVINSPLGRD